LKTNQKIKIYNKYIPIKKYIKLYKINYSTEILWNNPNKMKKGGGGEEIKER